MGRSNHTRDQQGQPSVNIQKSRAVEGGRRARRAIEIRKRVLGEEHPFTLISMGNLVSTYRNQGQWKKAEELEVYNGDEK